MNCLRSISQIAAILAAALPPSTAIAQERIVNGNFESFSGGLPTSWTYTQGEGTSAIQAPGQSSPFAGIYSSGSNSVLLTDGPSAQLSPVLNQTFPTAFGPTTLSFDFRLSSITGNDWSCIFSAFNGTTLSSVVYLSIDEEGNTLRFGPGGPIILILSPNVWYHFEALADTSSHTVSGSVTPFGQPPVMFNSVPFLQNFERFDNCRLWDESGFNQTGAGTNSPINFDNVSIRQASEPTPNPDGNGKIAFYSNRDGNFEIYIIDPNGSNPIRLTNNLARDEGPAWAPDGATIAFTSVRDGDFEIYVMDAVGSNQTRLTNSPAEDSGAVWSPDGAKIAFTSARDGDYEIYAMDANGSNPNRLTNSLDLDFSPTWSPDGTKIAFVSNRDGNYEIYVIDANGSNPTRLTNNPNTDFSIGWSPDGTKIAFVSNRDGNNEIYVMDSNGSNPVRLTNNLASDFHPAWSPDSAKIAFESERDGNLEIYVMEANGSNPIRLTNNSGSDRNPDWQRISAPGQAGNISTRLRVETGDNVLIGGFIVTGTQPKRVIVRAIGPSLTNFGVPGALANPTLELYGPSGLLASNDNWMDAPNRQEIIDSTLAPTNNFESAILRTLPANDSAYTAIVRGVANGTGVGLVEAYDLGLTVDSRLANISTRGFVQTGDDVMIGGFIVVGQTSTRVIVRAIGPSLSIQGKLADPTLELRDGNGGLLQSNNNWRTDQEAEIVATTIPPSNDLESAIVRPLNPGNYTAILRGVNNGTGLGLIEAYDLGPP